MDLEAVRRFQNHHECTQRVTLSENKPSVKVNVIWIMVCGRINEMDISEVQKKIEAEFAAARASRTAGNEGRARVCARRAAGLALGIYYAESLAEIPPQSAYKLLQWFSLREEIPQELRDAAKRLIVRVTTEFELPHRQDPLHDARLIAETILSGDI